MQKGDRVRMSPRGLAHLPYHEKMAARLGTVVGFGRIDANAVRVQWDGNSTTTSYHRSFVEVVRDEGKP